MILAHRAVVVKSPVSLVTSAECNPTPRPSEIAAFSADSRNIVLPEGLFTNERTPTALHNVSHCVFALSDLGSELTLPRFRGHRPIGGRGVSDGQHTRRMHARRSATKGRARMNLHHPASIQILNRPRKRHRPRPSVPGIWVDDHHASKQTLARIWAGTRHDKSRIGQSWSSQGGGHRRRRGRQSAPAGAAFGVGEEIA